MARTPRLQDTKKTSKSGQGNGRLSGESGKRTSSSAEMIWVTNRRFQAPPCESRVRL